MTAMGAHQPLESARQASAFGIRGSGAERPKLAQSGRRIERFSIYSAGPELCILRHRKSRPCCKCEAEAALQVRALEEATPARDRRIRLVLGRNGVRTPLVRAG
jgi:hypothetical protein